MDNYDFDSTPVFCDDSMNKRDFYCIGMPLNIVEYDDARKEYIDIWEKDMYDLIHYFDGKLDDDDIYDNIFLKLYYDLTMIRERYMNEMNVYECIDFKKLSRFIHMDEKSFTFLIARCDSNITAYKKKIFKTFDEFVHLYRDTLRGRLFGEDEEYVSVTYYRYPNENGKS